MNDLHKVARFSEVTHFADDTNLLLADKSLKKINKHINHDLALITTWLRANKISLNTSKTEIIIFRSKRKTITKKLNFRISGQKIPISKTVKYLGVILNENLSWDSHMDYILPKLNRGLGLLSKIRYCVPNFLLRTIYFCLFNSHLIYASQVWAQQKTILQKLQVLQNKALRIINFKPRDSSANELYFSTKILKISDYLKLLNCLLVKDVLTDNSLKVFSEYFERTENQHNHQTRHTARNCVKLNTVNTGTYGLNSVKHQSSLTWNDLQNKVNIDMYSEHTTKIKEELKEYFFNQYNQQ